MGLTYLFSLNQAVAPSPEPVVQNTEPQVNVPEGWKTYSNFGLQISYPPTWEVNESPDKNETGKPINVRIVGDGYQFIIELDRFGSSIPPNLYQSAGITVAGQKIIAQEQISQKEGNLIYSLIFILPYPQGNQGYLFKVGNSDSRLTRGEAKTMIQKILETVRILSK